MPKEHQPRSGSLQYWPRKRAKKQVPSINWNPLEDKYKNEQAGLLGAIGYKVGMESIIVRDEKPTSMAKGQEIFMPVSIIEFAPLRILSIRLYNKNKIVGEIFNNLAKEYKWLKRKIKLSKQEKSKENILKELEERAQNASKIRLLVYTKPKLIGLKKTPEIAEVGMSGSKEKQIEFIKNNLDKDISIKSIFKANSIVDVRGVTKGKGTSGPIKRFGIGKKQHKSEKGVRRPGSIGPWIPSKVSFRAPLMGQLGFFTRTDYNKYVFDISNVKEKDINKKTGFPRYGIIDFMIVKGSVFGPSKRALFITFPLRPTDDALKQKYNIIKLNYDSKER